MTMDVNPSRYSFEVSRFVYCDPVGVIHAKTVLDRFLNSKIEGGIGLTRAQNAMTVFDDLVPIEGMRPVGEIRAIPDVDSLREVPWLPNTNSYMCDLVEHNRTEHATCGRSVLKRAIAAAADAGIVVKAAFEGEFYLAQRNEREFTPYVNGPVYSTAGIDRVAHVMYDIVENLEKQQIAVEQVINEYGTSQQEISVRYTDALTAADNQIRFRDTVRGTTEIQHGLVASLAPKPFPNEIGSGAHLHFSLWSIDGSTNLLATDSDVFEVSELGLAFIAGLLRHLPALIALTCPSTNSFERIQPNAWAGNTVSWGYDNRECSVRVASPFFGQEASSINLELKACDASANPYLALAALIFAGLDGVKNKLVPGDPCDGNPAELSDSERERMGITNLPSTLSLALENLRSNVVLNRGIGEKLIAVIVALRESEIARVETEGANWARNRYFDLY
jgi:glutamine synthetase